MMDFDTRFGGVKRVYGQQGFEAIKQANIGIIGIGGVGSWMAEALARSGVGKLTLIDMDDVEVSNINRQIHALNSSLHQPKVAVMKARIAEINPACHCEVIEDFIGSHNVEHYLTEDRQGNKFDYIVDACDSIRAKSAIIYWCKRNKRPVITIGGAGGQKDPTQIQVADLNQTYSDPLAAKLRTVLSYHYGFTNTKKNQSSKRNKWGVECVFSSEQLKYPQADGSVSFQKNYISGGAKMDCNQGLGALSFVTATFAFVATARVLDKLVDKHAQLNRQQ